MMIPVIQVHVVQMRIAITESAHVYPNIRVIPIVVVGPSAFLIRTVLVIRHVCETNALIHARERVVKTPYAKCSIMFRCVAALLE